MNVELNTVDPGKAFEMFEQMQTDPDAPLPQEQDTTAAAAPAVEAAAKEEPQTTDAVTNDEQEPQGIATKDGKHVIPYSVLKSERDRAAQAERQLQETLARVEELQRQVANAAKTGAKDDGEGARTTPHDTTEDVSPEDLAFLEEEFPTVAKALKVALAKASALEAKLTPVEDRLKNDEQAEQQRRAMTVQEAIDANPKLAHIQASDPDAFAVAQQFDSLLRNQAAWADKPLAERFAKVIDMVEAANGPINVPGHTTQAKAAAPQANLREQAAAAVAARAKPAVPTSLSQFPAGEPVATDEAAAIEQMSHAELAGKLARMTPEQQLNFLANL